MTRAEISLAIDMWDRAVAAGVDELDWYDENKLPGIHPSGLVLEAGQEMKRLLKEVLDEGQSVLREGSAVPRQAG